MKKIGYILIVLTLWSNLLKAQQNNYPKIIIEGDSLGAHNNAYWQSYIKELKTWALEVKTTGTWKNELPSPATPLPENVQNIKVAVRTSNLSDSMQIKIVVYTFPPMAKRSVIKDVKTQVNGQSVSIDLSVGSEPRPMPRYERMEPEENEGAPNDHRMPPPPSGPNGPRGRRGPGAEGPRRERQRNRMNQMGNAHKIIPVITNYRMNLGFLGMYAQGNEEMIFIPATPKENLMPALNRTKSLQIGFALEYGVNLYRGKIRLWTGLNYDIQNYRFRDDNVRINPSAEQFEWSYANNPNPNKHNTADKSKLVTNYLGVPLAIGFQNKPNKPTLSLRLGIQAGLLVRAHTKVRYLDGYKEKNFTDFNMNPIAIHTFALVQYKSWGLYGKVGQTPVIMNDRRIGGQNPMPGANDKNWNFAFGITHTFKN